MVNATVLMNLQHVALADTGTNDTSRYTIPREGCPFLPWNLERIQEDTVSINGQLSKTDDPVVTGSGVHIYVIDTGIVPHIDFGSRIGQGLDCTRGGECRLDNELTDALGHGTAVASQISGTCLGVAPGATIHPVRVIDSNGNGSLQSIINGIRWATETSKANGWRGVINISLTNPASQEINEAVAKAVEQGMVVVTAAGNQGSDACEYSPGSSPSSLTVGATKIGYDDDVLVDDVSLLSNTGRCVTVYAPGEDIPSASNMPENGTKVYNQIVTLSGTSQAAPLVSGAAALYLETHPSATPEELIEAIQDASLVFDSNQSKSQKDACCTILNIQNLS